MKARIWMMSTSEGQAIEVGWRIHQAVIAEGRREGVFAYLYHSPDGRAWFEKYDRKTKEVHRRFSAEVAAMIKGHVAELKIYARRTGMRDQKGPDPHPPGQVLFERQRRKPMTAKVSGIY